MQSFIMNSHEVFIHIHQGCFAGTGAIVRLPQCQWSKPDGYGKISQCITTKKHSKAKTVCIFLGVYCINNNQPYDKSIVVIYNWYLDDLISVCLKYHTLQQMTKESWSPEKGCLYSEMCIVSTAVHPSNTEQSGDSIIRRWRGTRWQDVVLGMK